MAGPPPPLLLVLARWPGRALTYQMDSPNGRCGVGATGTASRERNRFLCGFLSSPSSFLSCLLSHSTSRWCRVGGGCRERSRSQGSVHSVQCVRACVQGKWAARRLVSGGGRSSCVVGLRRIEGRSVLPCRHVVHTTWKQRRCREASCRRRAVVGRSHSQFGGRAVRDGTRSRGGRVDVVARSLALCRLFLSASQSSQC